MGQIYKHLGTLRVKNTVKAVESFLSLNGFALLSPIQESSI